MKKRMFSVGTKKRVMGRWKESITALRRRIVELELSIFIGKISVQKMDGALRPKFVYQLVPGIAVAAPENMCPHLVNSGVFV